MQITGPDDPEKNYGSGSLNILAKYDGHVKKKRSTFCASCFSCFR